MTEQPKTVVCTSCSAKFHVPDELIRGKLVKFRCRKCGEAIDVDGRKSARPPAVPAMPAAEITAVDTPATFSQRTLPPPRPPSLLSSSSTNLHPWPEPPRTRSTTAPMAISDSGAPEESLPRAQAVRDPSNRGPKIAAVVALLMAAGLSGVGLAMRNTPGASGTILVHGTSEQVAAAEPSDPQPTSNRAPAAGVATGAQEARSDDPRRPSRNPTRVTDLPTTVDGVEPAPAGLAGAAMPGESAIEKETPAPHEALPSGVPIAANADTPASGATDEPAPGANPPSGGAMGVAAAAPNAVPPPALIAPSSAGAAPAAAARAKGDFNTQAAREALEDAAGRAGKCKTIDTPSGTARIAVTFATNGHVTNAVIESGPLVGTAAGSCVASKFRAARVPTFTGDPVQVHKSVLF